LEILRPVEKDLGEFTVRRTLPASERQRVGPFIFFDHMGPAVFPSGSGVSVRPHPHIGLATITYLFDGAIMHRDSLGYQQAITPGAVNWMTAGRGIVHSERTPAALLESGSSLHGIQTWLALPLEAEEIAPAFDHYPREQIPEAMIDGVHVSLIVGAMFGLESPVRTASRSCYASLRMATKTSVQLPENYDEVAIYVVDGSIQIGGTELGAGLMAVPAASDDRTIIAQQDSHIMLLGGDTLPGKRYLWWNFVSSSRERIEAAKRQWKAGDFASVPDDPEFIPLPE